MDAMQLVEAKLAEASKRATKLRQQLAVVEEDLRRLEITAETLARLNLNPTVEMPVPRGQSYNQVFDVLGESEKNAKSPKEIHDALIAIGINSISQDNVRTILSRRKEHFASSDGRYWRRSGLQEVEPPNGEPVGGSQSALDAQQREGPEW